MSLVLHQGLPNTATTSLQKWVLPLHPGYIGKHHGLTEPNEVKRIRPALRSYRIDGPNWEGSVFLPDSEELRLDSETWILSDEGLWPRGKRMPFADGYVNPDFSGGHPLVQRRYASRTTPSKSEKLKIIVTFRKQADLYGSLYAQLASQMVTPSQEDFERKARATLRDQPNEFDYYLLANDLLNRFGAENVLFLFFEDGLYENINKIGSFLNFDFRHGQAIPQEKRRFQSDSWLADNVVISPTRFGHLGMARAFLEESLPNGGVLKRALKRLAHGADQLAITPAKPKSLQLAIEVPNILSQQIASRFAESNKALARLSSRDLSSLGYY